MLGFCLLALVSVAGSWPDESRSFQYDTGNVVFHENLDRGVVTGFYDYVDPNGKIQHVEYIADSKGFRVRATNIPLQVHKIPKGTASD